MIQVVRWYLSAFHAGRRSEVAKKPYNPILGETFQCWWDVPDLNVDKSEPAKDGPVPWCSKQQLAFIAEQVSLIPLVKESSATKVCLDLTPPIEEFEYQKNSQQKWEKVPSVLQILCNLTGVLTSQL
ncbi:hypothetical protein QYM36_008520 [Artemia franciscana]|uniref:Uncharacterized protein n=1 Tax=Artemia franciscana TaxID=6661 RepID=A0AA88LI79_ARTSF|nr:hypothetical protein QYM36_008520 [Artemia franciscana]